MFLYGNRELEKSLDEKKVCRCNAYGFVKGFRFILKVFFSSLCNTEEYVEETSLRPLQQFLNYYSGIKNSNVYS